ncbi:unnamed protein product [Coregonus sp. 'balchen']|nr:unnamed protein product [Coregonus sp. 'balchen']
MKQCGSQERLGGTRDTLSAMNHLARAQQSKRAQGISMRIYSSRNVCPP